MGDAVYEDDRYLVNGTVLGSQYFRRDIQQITFLDSLVFAPNTAWDLSAATDLSQMFYHCKSLTSLGVEALVVPASADTTEMYAGTPWDS